MLTDGSNRFKRADRADRTVILAAVHYGVEMRAREHRRCFGIVASQAAEDVADTVDAHFQSSLAHQMNQHLPAAQLFDGKHQPSHRAAVADPDTADGIEVAHQAAWVDGGRGGWMLGQ